MYHKNILIKCLLPVLLLLPLASPAEVLVKWDMAGTSGSQTETPAVSWTNALTPNPIRRGKGFPAGKTNTFTPSTMTFYVTPGVIKLADALAQNAYFEIIITPAEGDFSISLKSLSFASKRASRKSGPNYYTVRSSLDNFSADLIKPVATHPNTLPQGGDVTLDFGDNLKNIKKPFALRIYAFGRERDEQKSGLLAIYNHSKFGGIVLDGSIVGKPAIPLARVERKINAESLITAPGLVSDNSKIPNMPSSKEVIQDPQVTTKIISHQPEYYHGWATVALGKNGRLHLTYSGGRDFHVCPFGRLEYMVSDDGGESWSWPRVLMDSLIDDRDSGILETKNGVLLASFFTSIAYQIHMNAPDRLMRKEFGPEWDKSMFKRWQTAELSATQEERKGDVGYWLVRSTDGGLTWSARYKSEPGYCPHGPINLLDGRVFYAAGNGKKASAWVSADDGLTWTHLADLPVRAGELHSVQAANGTLIVHVRASGGGTQQVESKDGGKTWSQPRYVTRGYGHPSHLLRLKDNSILMTYGSRVAPLGMRAKISRDNGESWSEEFFLTKDAHNWDQGYPSTVQLSDGSLVTIWYEAPANSPKAQLRQAKWRLPAKP